MIPQSHDQICDKRKRIFIFKTVVFCMEHVTVTVEQQRKCEVNFSRKRCKIMTKQSQVHVDNMERHIYLLNQNEGIDFTTIDRN